jgi:hypothetical protein
MIKTPTLLAATILIACASQSQQLSPASTTDPITESDIRRVLSTLAADSMEGRFTGSRGANKAAAFLTREMQSIGLKPAGDSGYYQRVPLSETPRDGKRPQLKLLDSFAALDSVAPDLRRIGYNLIGVIPGSDPVLRDQVVAFAAHYDHLGIGTPVNGDSIYNGADDDASGVAAVLGVARALVNGAPPKRTIVILLTTGEEEGILGTRWYVAHPAFPILKMVAEMEIEMAGRPDSLAGGPGKAWMTGYDRSTMGSMLKQAGIPIVPDPYPQYQFFQRSDNIVFARMGIPAHTLSTYNLHKDYHTVTDDVAGIDFPHLTAVSRAAAAAARLLADGPAPQWKPDGQPAAR